LLSLVARLLSVPVVIEFHELQDPAEQRLLAAAVLNRFGLRLLTASVGGVIAHSESDMALLEPSIGLRPTRAVIGHGPYDHLVSPEPAKPGGERMTADTDGATSPTTLLFFGLIRPYKGLEDLVEAFDRLDPEQADQFRLLVVGETWEGWTLPTEAIAASRYRDRITFVNRYVADDEVGRYFAEADALVLPYRRVSSSGPLNIAMAAGLHVVVYDLPALAEALGGYEGVVLVPEGDIGELSAALLRVREMKGRRVEPRRGWDQVVDRYTDLLRSVIRR
jgi:glycosyltransferase involved in cell wall biosynthesis